ncbi:MAG: Xaa-Pro peptidase family protein [Candidatus Gracilibacteria bacterium]|nr:Xaa-Pro peptidase family protein [Candidatus Gracilibacteria bacterium]
MIKLLSSEALLITKSEHIFYLTNFDGEGFVIVTKDGITLATDQRYWLLAKEVKKKGVKLFDLKHGWPEKLNERLKKIKTVLFEERNLTIAGLERWKKILPKRKWKKSGGVVEKMRLIKSDDELENLREAARIGDKILKRVLKEMKPGVTEKTMANLFRKHSDELANGVSFDPIVAFGKNGAVPHHHSGSTKLKKNDAILIDQGVNYKGYMSDMTRCFQIGKGIPAVNDMHVQLLEAQQAGVNMVRAGVNIKDLSIAVRGILGKDQKYFTHSLGHGVGIEIHETPGVSSRTDMVLKAGMVITIEPGLYKPGIGGVRIEDTVIVTEDGCEVITKSSKKTQL